MSASETVATEINLGATPDRTLIRVLRRRGYVVLNEDDVHASALDMPEFDEAAARLQRGEVAEALIWLERALPDTFAGLSTAAVPART